jgi:hypothetical protein
MPGHPVELSNPRMMRALAHRITLDLFPWFGPEEARTVAEGPVAGALVGVAILGGLTQREFRTFGARDEVTPEVAYAAADPKAAEGSRK